MHLRKLLMPARGLVQALCSCPASKLPNRTGSATRSTARLATQGADMSSSTLVGYTCIEQGFLEQGDELIY